MFINLVTTRYAVSQMRVQNTVLACSSVEMEFGDAIQMEATCSTRGVKSTVMRECATDDIKCLKMDLTTGTSA